MGFLKNLFEIAGKVASVAQELADKQEKDVKKTPSPAPVRSSAPAPEKTAAEWRSYFREIIRTTCAGYDVREDVPVTLPGRCAQGRRDAGRRTQPFRQCQVPDRADVHQETRNSLHQLLHADAQRTCLCRRPYPQVSGLVSMEKGDATSVAPAMDAASPARVPCRRPW